MELIKVDIKALLEDERKKHKAVIDFDYEALMNWFTDFDNAVRCRSREEIDEVLDAIGKYGVATYSGAYDVMDDSHVTYFARVRYNRREVVIGYGRQEDIDRHPEYKPIEFSEFVRRFSAANIPSLLEMLEVS